eukprot:scaffold233520_cov23-Tisochrysis_lutea.AAC.1
MEVVQEHTPWSAPERTKRAHVMTDKHTIKDCHQGTLFQSLSLSMQKETLVHPHNVPPPANEQEASTEAMASSTSRLFDSAWIWFASLIVRKAPAH